MPDFTLYRGENRILVIDFFGTDGTPVSLGVLVSIAIEVFYRLDKKYLLALYTEQSPEIKFTGANQISLELTTLLTSACFAPSLGVGVRLILPDSSFVTEKKRVLISKNLDAVRVLA